jgi:RHS repeat-associated protein
MVDATYYYDAFGNIIESTGDVNNNITYAGYQYDEETGLYYLNTRMYDPKIARFLHEDTYRGDINDPLSLNLYVYCANNPLIYWDPTGDDYITILTGENRGTVEWEDKTKVAKVVVNGVTMNYKVVNGEVWEYDEKNDSLMKKVGTIKDNKIDVTKDYFHNTFFEETIRLSNKNLMQIFDESNTYFGGNQNWFDRFTQRFGGCGPTAAANILAYIGVFDSSLANNNTKSIAKDDFKIFMDEVYKYVKPLEEPISSIASDIKDRQIGIPSYGIFSLNYFAKSVEKFAKSKGITLEACWSSEKPTFENQVNYIKEGLSKESPVAMMIMFNPVSMKWTDPRNGKKYTKKIDRHWVTITGIIENKRTGEVTLEVSSWGGKGTVSFNDLYNHWTESIFSTQMIYFKKNE